MWAVVLLLCSSWHGRRLFACRRRAAVHAHRCGAAVNPPTSDHFRTPERGGLHCGEVATAHGTPQDRRDKSGDGTCDTTAPTHLQALQATGGNVNAAVERLLGP